MSALFFILFSLFSTLTFAQTKLPVVSSEQLQIGNQWTWDYYEPERKLYSSERYTIVARSNNIVTIELWTKLAASATFSPSARFVVNLQDCWLAFKSPVKKEFGLTVHNYEKNKWSSTGYKVSSTAFEEKFNCNPHLYSDSSMNYETVFETEPTPWGAWLTFQQKPRKKNSQLYSYYFADHQVLKAVAYRKRFNPSSPYEFEMELSKFEVVAVQP